MFAPSSGPTWKAIHSAHLYRKAPAEHGLDLPMENVARRVGVGVGVGTLHRRYPTHVDLVAAAFGHKMTAYA